MDVIAADDEASFYAAKRAKVYCDEAMDPTKNPNFDESWNVPLDFLFPMSLDDVIEPSPLSVEPPPPPMPPPPEGRTAPRQFWKAGDYEGPVAETGVSTFAGIDHVRVHPKFLHSNATSHKWALGALAELLDNSMDEVCHGATFVNIDMLQNMKDGTKMLLVEDNGGGMNPDTMRQCMSLGYSVKSKSANTIGQYGNGFKTSTMRLGADVIVFSRCPGKGGESSTQSIGLLSYTFLRKTGKEDIVVPMIDYEKGEDGWNRMVRSSSDVWKTNLETIQQWSPYSSEIDLLHQLNLIGDQGTKVVIYNLWDDDQGELELDFDTDEHDIQVRGCNRDEKKIQMAKQFPNSRHFLTYRHSLRSYASILYLRIPNGFKMVLRGKKIEHHNIVNDMMMKANVTYRPQPGPDGVSKDSSTVAVVTLGFVKDAKDHIDVQGFNVYHKNRLIKPFWRVWNAAGSDGRGVIGVLEANFVEPAHDKQGFERTTVLSRLEARLLHMQKQYWSANCHKIGYAPRQNRKTVCRSEDRGNSLDDSLPSSPDSKKTTFPSVSPDSNRKCSAKQLKSDKSVSNSNRSVTKRGTYSGSNRKFSPVPDVPLHSPISDVPLHYPIPDVPLHSPIPNLPLHSQIPNLPCNGTGSVIGNSIQQLIDENSALKLRLKNVERKMSHSLHSERDQSRALAEQLAAKVTEIRTVKEERDALMNRLQEEISRHGMEESNMKKKLEEAFSTISQLTDRLYSENHIKRVKLMTS